MFLLPLPLLFAGLGAIGRGSAAEMLGELGGFAGLMLSAWLLNEGLRAEEAYAARAVARPPAIPRKLFAAVLTGASVFARRAARPRPGARRRARLRRWWRRRRSSLAFGLDPMRKKGLEGVDEFATERVARAIDQAEALVRADRRRRGADRRPAARGPGRPALRPGARGVPRRRAGPARPRAGRAPSSASTCSGLRDATVKFADLWGRSRDPEARTQYEALLGDLETSFTTAPHAAARATTAATLDIEIEVLRERLQQDGLIAR